MCAIIGGLCWGLDDSQNFRLANALLRYIYQESHARGRDGRGAISITDSFTIPFNSFRDTERSERVPPGEVTFLPTSTVDLPNQLIFDYRTAVVLMNLRAEPTTEFVRNKIALDQQPYSVYPWNIVHNGTIANDKELRTNELTTKIDSAAIVETLAKNEGETHFKVFINTMRKLKGSFAILAAHNQESDTIYAAANYRPIWYIETPFGIFFASSRHYFPTLYSPRMLKPYSIARFERDTYRTEVTMHDLHPRKTDKKLRALVVCSGGLDSVVAATVAQRSLGYDVTLLHFIYGSRAQFKEIDAIKVIGEHLKCKVQLIPISGIYDKSDSPLLNADSEFAGGEEGAEFAHEWVPARNLVMLSVATAYAEAKGFEKIILGNNLEEAGAYPDNEPEFIERFNDMLPFATADGKHVEIMMPVGNLMKHEIVALGKEVDAPMHLTWSCYRAGDKHCGKCGPCYMRRTAFKINNLEEVIEYDV